MTELVGGAYSKKGALDPRKPGGHYDLRVRLVWPAKTRREAQPYVDLRWFITGRPILTRLGLTVPFDDWWRFVGLVVATSRTLLERGAVSAEWSGFPADDERWRPLAGAHLRLWQQRRAEQRRAQRARARARGVPGDDGAVDDGAGVRREAP